MGNDVVSLLLRCNYPGGCSFNLLITFYKEVNYMAPFNLVNSITEQLLLMLIL